MRICLITDDGTRSLTATEFREWSGGAGEQPLPTGERNDDVAWVHLDYRDHDGMALLTDCVDVRPDDLQEVAGRSPVPKLHMYTDHHFSAISGLARGTDDLLYFQPIKVFLTRQTLWTVIGPVNEMLPPHAAEKNIDHLRTQVDAQSIRPRTAFELIAALRAVMLRSQEELIASGARKVAAMERRVMTFDPASAESVLQELFQLRHDFQIIRINAAQTYELYDNLLDTLAADESLLPIDPRRLALLRQQYGHLKNTADLERDYLQEVLDLFQTRVASELNVFVRKITAWGTIAIAWTVVASVYGMNFQYMPELTWSFGYPLALGVMLIISTLLWFFFHRRRWL